VKKKIKIVENSKTRKLKSLNEDKLREYRIMFKDDKSDLKALRVDLLKMSNNIRKESIKTLTTGMLDAIKDNDLEDVSKFRLATPRIAKELTRLADFYIIDESMESEELLLKKHPNFYQEMIEVIYAFESSLNEMFDMVETMLNGILLEETSSVTYVDTLKKCLENNLLNYHEFSVLRTFGIMRNLFAHNSVMNIFAHELNSDKIMLFKALVLEVHLLIKMLMLRHYERLLLYKVVILFSTGDIEKTEEKLQVARDMQENILKEAERKNITYTKLHF
jgi:hypothetical protein